jgi:hypothetical protein
MIECIDIPAFPTDLLHEGLVEYRDLFFRIISPGYTGLVCYYHKEIPIIVKEPDRIIDAGNHGHLVDPVGIVRRILVQYTVTVKKNGLSQYFSSGSMWLNSISSHLTECSGRKDGGIVRITGSCPEF